MHKTIFILFLASCVEAPWSFPTHPRFPLTIYVPLDNNYNDAYRQIKNHTDELNARLGCEAVKIADEPADVNLRWASWPELANEFDQVKQYGGVSVRDRIENTIWIAMYDLPEELSTTGLLSSCEAGYLWLFWIGQMAGLRAQYTEPTKITYAHPNCPGYIKDLVGALVLELENNELKGIVCGE